jgi:hypothetical protein
MFRLRAEIAVLLPDPREDLAIYVPQLLSSMNDRNDKAAVCDVPVLLGSVVIPAHDEARVIERCLDALFAGASPGSLDVLVVCNGCTDDTAQRARGSEHLVRVCELPQASKAEALRVGDANALCFPRLYLDADVVLPGESARRVLQRLAGGAIAARPPLRYDTTRSSALVRSYFRARGRVPSVLGALWGAGVYGLSERGRSRFVAFPDVVADDLWIDNQFARHEVEIVDAAPVVVTAPRRARDLLRILQRANRGKFERGMPEGAAARARTTTRAALADLRRSATSSPSAVVDAFTYVAFALSSRLLLALTAPATLIVARDWERDGSSRA